MTLDCPVDRSPTAIGLVQVTRLESGRRERYPKRRYRLLRLTCVRTRNPQTRLVDIDQVPRLERGELAYREQVPGR